MVSWATCSIPRLIALACAGPSVLGCGQRVTTIGLWEPPEPSFFFEAEAGELTGFDQKDDTLASNDAFIVPGTNETFDSEPGSARARYTFTLQYDASIVVWGRIRSPDVDSNRFWFRLDDEGWTKWRITVGDIWYWDDFHDDTNYGKRLEFDLPAGEHELWLANATPNSALDQLFISGGSRPTSDQQTECDPPHSIELDGQCHASCGSQNGTTCGETACMGRATLESYDCDVCCTAAP